MDGKGSSSYYRKEGYESSVKRGERSDFKQNVYERHSRGDRRETDTKNTRKRHSSQNKREYDGHDSTNRHHNNPSKRSKATTKSCREEDSKVSDFKKELKGFLEDHAGISQTEEFWKFFEKYETMQQLRGHSEEIEKEKLLIVDYRKSLDSLFEKVPLQNSDRGKFLLTHDQFKYLMLTVRIYQDFQQKTKFAKLKKLREGQSELPMSQYKETLLKTLETKRVVLIAGDTGCGKSTQVPQYILEGGYKKVVCTQPRRIACISLAKRVAHETLSEFKDTIGYQIRFEKSKNANTKVIFMTEGLLLRHASDEDTLKTYDVIILDEVHERHLHGDFLIGIMKCLLHKRDDFKLILMSATINIDLFKNYFADEAVEVIQVPGRLFPIDIKYFPIIKDPYERKRDRFDCTPYLRILEMIDKEYEPSQKGDLLIFLNGFSEISTLADTVNEYAEKKKNWIVLILHSSLSLSEQDKVFDYPPNGVRKCIISTNIAETSVTINGIRFVVDSGKVNRMSYVTAGGINKLTEVLISQDSAKQRAGRAGRTGPGICYRLYSEEDFKNFDAFTPAEIHLVPLESLFLQMIVLGLQDISCFPFLEKPDPKSIAESIDKLKFCGALVLNKDSLELTPLGEALSRLPVDLSIGKMLIMSTVFGNVTSVLVLAALLSVQSPITQQAHRNPNIEELLKSLNSDHGDPISLLNYYKEWLNIKQNSTVASSNQTNYRDKKRESSRQWAKKHGLEEQRFYEATKLFGQFRDILVDAQLLSKGPSKELSKGERAIRYGELKHLKSIRHQLKNEARTSRHKQLKFESYSLEDCEKSVESTDLRDVEFRILNDSKNLEKLMSETSTVSYKNLMFLKLIVTCGLYPQVAIEDEFNSSKTVSEKLYHTKDKHYIFLRPFSYFALNPETLELSDDHIEIPPPGYFSKRPLSRKHQILIYQSILETKKVYLVNAMRMPTIQTLMLFSKTIVTNSTLTKFVFDNFLMLDLPYFGQGKTLLLRAVEMRKTWNDKLEHKLKNLNFPENSQKNDEEIFNFVEDLTKYMQTEVIYNIKRLLPADLKLIYNSNSEYFEVNLPKNTVNPFDSNYPMTVNNEYGGLQVTENIIYNCLVQDEWEYAIDEQVSCEPFECPLCKETKLGYSFFDILRHESLCRAKSRDQSSTSSVQPVKPNSKLYDCPKCGKSLMLSPVDILKHKKACV